MFALKILSVIKDGSGALKKLLNVVKRYLNYRYINSNYGKALLGVYESRNTKVGRLFVYTHTGCLNNKCSGPF